MKVKLPRALKDYIDEQVEAGLYASSGEVVREALRQAYYLDGAEPEEAAAPESVSAEVLAALQFALYQTGAPAEVSDGLFRALREGSISLDVESQLLLVLKQIAEDADRDLRTMMDEMRERLDQKEALRDLMDELRSSSEGQESLDGPADLLAGSQRQLWTLIKAVERDIARNSGPGDNGSLDLTSGLGDVETYLSIRLPRRTDSGGWSGQVLVAPRGPLTLEDLIEAKKAALDSISDLAEMESLRLQMYMDRLSKLMSTISNLLKKISDTQGSIIHNLK